MEIHQVNGRDLRDALERAREAMGDDAVVLSRRAGNAGGVMLAVADARPATREALARLRLQARELLARSPQVHRAPRPRATTADVERALREQGASERLVARICEAVAGRLDEGLHPLDLAGEELRAVFPAARAPRIRGQAVVVALLGPTGVGKTTSAVKLASRWSRAGRRVGLATLDGERVGAAGELSAWGARIGAPTATLTSGARLVGALAGPRAPEVVVVDGSGRPERDLAELAGLVRAARERGVPLALQRLAVLSAAHGEEVLERTVANLEVDGCGITKLDETGRPARVLELAVREQLSIAFLTDGPELTRLHSPTPDHFADLLLRGRIS